MIQADLFCLLFELCSVSLYHDDGQIVTLNSKIAATSVYEVHISNTMKEKLSNSSEFLE